MIFHFILENSYVSNILTLNSRSKSNQKCSTVKQHCIKRRHGLELVYTPVTSLQSNTMQLLTYIFVSIYLDSYSYCNSHHTFLFKIKFLHGNSQMGRGDTCPFHKSRPSPPDRQAVDRHLIRPFILHLLQCIDIVHNFV